MRRQRRQEPEQKSASPRGDKRCICAGTGQVYVMANKHTPGFTPWTEGVRFWWRAHCVSVLCKCPVGRWIRETWEAAVNRRDAVCVPYLDHDPRVMVLEDEFRKAYAKWESKAGPAPVVSQSDIPVEQLDRSPLDRYDTTSEWLPQEAA